METQSKPATRFTLFLRSLDDPRTAREETLGMSSHVRADAEREARQVIDRRAAACERIFSWQLVEHSPVMWCGLPENTKGEAQ